MIKVPLGPWIVPDKLFNEPCSTNPLKFIRMPDISFETLTEPPTIRLEGSGMKLPSVSIDPFSSPSKGPFK